jgi:transcription antitermination factor NusG
MPVFEEQASLFPETLLEGIPDDVQGRQWWVLYTRSRREKAVARHLLGYEIPFYLPLVEKNAVRRGQRVRTLVPLFAGYVFLYGCEEERVLSLTTNHISRVLDVPDPDGLRGDLRQLRQLLAANVPLTVESRLAPGARVRVRYGPMEGIEGTVLSRRGRTRLLVAVDFLQQGASVEINDFMLEPIDWHGSPSGARKRPTLSAHAVG